MILIKKGIDVRVKLIFAFCISTLSVLYKGYLYMTLLLFIALGLATLFKGDIAFVFNKTKRVFGVFVMMIFVQSLFVKSGTPIIAIKSICLITDIGLLRAFEFIMRITIIVISSTIIMTSNSREIIQGLIQLGLPYELAFMVSIAVRFLPILSEEMKDSITAIELRGIDISDLKLKSKLDLYRYIFTPVVIGAIDKAKKLSISMECRGFRAYDYRTSIIRLRFGALDYSIIIFSLLSTTIGLILYYGG